MQYNSVTRQHPAVELELMLLHNALITLRKKKKVGGKQWCLLDKAASLCEAVVEDNLSKWTEYYTGFTQEPEQLELFPELGPAA